MVLGGVTECMMLHGWDPNGGTDAAEFLEYYPRRMASTGAALIFIDHVLKSRGSHERYAIGSVHKLNGIDGASYTFEGKRPFGRGMEGVSAVFVNKATMSNCGKAMVAVEHGGGPGPTRQLTARISPVIFRGRPPRPGSREPGAARRCPGRARGLSRRGPIAGPRGFGVLPWPGGTTGTMASMDLVLDEAVLRAAGVRLVVVFGSAARGAGRPDSDLDVGVLFDGGGRPPLPGEPAEPFEARREAVADALRAGREIDLVVLDEADPLLLHEVAVHGRPVFEAEPGVFEEFRIRAIKRYFDTAWIRRIEADVLRRRYG